MRPLHRQEGCRSRRGRHLQRWKHVDQFAIKMRGRAGKGGGTIGLKHNTLLLGLPCQSGIKRGPLLLIEQRLGGEALQVHWVPRFAGHGKVKEACKDTQSLVVTQTRLAKRIQCRKSAIQGNP